MELLLLIIYSVIVWLVFIKFKLLPWNIISQVIVVTLPIIGLTVVVLVLNMAAPSTVDVRVTNYVVQIVPNVAGRVIEVPVEANRPVKKGDVLFRIDPTPYEQRVRALEAQYEGLQAKLSGANSYQRQLDEQIKTAQAQRRALEPKLALARTRLEQARSLAKTGAGPQYDVEQAQANVDSLRAEITSADANIAQIRQKITAKTDSGDLAEVAQVHAEMAAVQAQLDEARWNLSQTTVYAPANGTVVNLQLREGAYTVPLPLAPVMTFVEDEQWIVAVFSQNELNFVKPGNLAEIGLRTDAGRIIKAEVDSIIWASGTGQMPIGGRVPEAGAAPIPEGRYGVRLRPVGEDAELFLPMGAQGRGAIYTDHVKLLHIIRKVFMRVGGKLDWLVLKLH